MTFPNHVTEARLHKLDPLRWHWRFQDDKTALLLYDQKVNCFAAYCFEVLDWSMPDNWYWVKMLEADDIFSLSDTYESNYKVSIAETALALLSDLETNTQQLLLLPEKESAAAAGQHNNGYHYNGQDFKCTNPFLDAQGFCSLCGKFHNKKETRAQLERRLARDAKRAAQHNQAVRRRVEKMLDRVYSNPYFLEAFETSDKVLADFELDARIRFSKMNSLCFVTQQKKDGVLLSFPLIAETAENGFGEMARLKEFTQHSLLYGREAAHQIALHACAHLITRIMGGNEYRNLHGAFFKDTYKLLMKNYPFIDPANQQQLQLSPGAAAEPLPAAQSPDEPETPTKDAWYFE